MTVTAAVIACHRYKPSTAAGSMPKPKGYCIPRADGDQVLAQMEAAGCASWPIVLRRVDLALVQSGKRRRRRGS
jgi:hypothetical protein